MLPPKPATYSAKQWATLLSIVTDSWTFSGARYWTNRLQASANCGCDTSVTRIIRP